MTKTEQAILVDLLGKYKTEQAAAAQPAAQAQAQQASIDSSLKALLDAGYQIVPPNAGASVQTPATPNNDVETMLKSIVSGMQSLSVQQVQQPVQETSDDILASIINPPLPEFGKEANGGFFQTNSK